MGVLQGAFAPLADKFSALGLGTQIAVGLSSVLILSVVLNVAQQILFRNHSEPPMVFHWFPFIGNTITYGIDPPKFYKECRERVRWPARR